MSHDVDISQPSVDFFFRETPRSSHAQKSRFVKDQLSRDNDTFYHDNL